MTGYPGSPVQGQQPQLPPRVSVACPSGHLTRTRQPEGTQLPCTRCSQEAGRVVMVTVPAGPGNRPLLRPPEPPATPGGAAQVLRSKRLGPSQAQCAGCHATVQMSAPPRAGEPAGWLHLYAGTPDQEQPAQRIGYFCSAECLALVLADVKQRVSELPYQVPDRPLGAATIGQLMREVPRGGR